MPLAAAAGLGEGVEEDDDVGVPLRMGLVHPRLAAPRGGPPVDAADAVAGHERPQVGELDPLAARARELVAGEGLRLERPQQLSQLLAARVDLQRAPPLERLLEDEQPEAVVRAEDEVADEVGAPALAAERVARARAARPACKPQQLRVRRLRDRARPGGRSSSSSRGTGVSARSSSVASTGSPSTCALGVELEDAPRPAAAPRARARRRAGARTAPRGRPAPGRPSTSAASRPSAGERGVRAELRRRRAGHSAPARASARPLPASAPGRAARARCRPAAAAAPRARAAARAGARARARRPPSRRPA